MDDLDSYALDLLTRHAPDFLRQAGIKLRDKTGDRRIEITLEQFDNSPLLLYAALLYAGSRGLTVTVAPKRTDAG
jgi:hypothetical protein